MPIWLHKLLLHLNGPGFSDAPATLPLSLGGWQGRNGGQTSKKCSGWGWAFMRLRDRAGDQLLMSIKVNARILGRPGQVAPRRRA